MDPPLGLGGVVLKPRKPLREVKAGPARHQRAGSARSGGGGGGGGGGQVQPHSFDAARLPCEAAEADDASLCLHRCPGPGQMGLMVTQELRQGADPPSDFCISESASCPYVQTSC